MSFVPSKEQIFAADDLDMITVPVPEWGGDGAVVYVKSMTGQQRYRFELSTVDPRSGKVKNLANFRERLIAHCVCDESGDPLFAESDIPKLAKKSAVVIERLFKAARKASGMEDEALEDEAENLDETGSDDSTID